MKAIKYLIAGVLMMGLSTSAMAQEVNYKDMLKPIETTLKAGNADPKEFAKALKEYQKVFKKDPKALVALGNILAMNKQYDDANLVADGVIAKFKNYGDAYILKGDIYALQDNGGEAATWYGQCMTMDPKNPQGYISYSNVYRKIDPAASADALNKLREINPDYPIEAEAGHNFFSAGNYDKAYEYFSKAKESTLEEYIYYEYAFSTYILNKKEETLSICQSGIKKFPKDASMQVLAMRAAVDLKNYEEALVHANIVMNTDSIKKNASIVSYYGLALAGNKQYNEAIEQYKKALEMKADDPKPLQYISEAYKDLGDEDKALEYNQQYMDKNPNAAPTDFMKLAEIYINKAKKDPAKKVENIEKAIGVYAKLAEKYPTLKPFAKLQEGNTAFQNELDDKAILAYEDVIKDLEAKQCDADEISYLKQAYQYMGFIYTYDKQDFDTAKPYFDKLLKLDPNNKIAKDAFEKAGIQPGA